MKRFLKRRWHSIPVGVLAVVMALVLISGSAFAAYNFLTVPVTITVEEPMVVSLDYDCNGIYETSVNSSFIFTDWGVAGDTRTFALKIENRANNPITVTVSLEGTWDNTHWFTFEGLPSGTIPAATGSVKGIWIGDVTVKVANDTPPRPTANPYTFDIVFERS